MEDTSNTASRTVAGFAKAGSGLLKLVGVFLLVYVVGVAIYGIVQYSTTKSKLLTYGLSDATGSLIAWTVMLVAFGAPAYAIFRIVMFKGKPIDYTAAMILPLISWGIAMIPANFDAKTGEALKYCAKRPGGEIFCLDRPGVDPLTKQPLVPMDAKLAERQFREGRGLVPKRITERVEKIQFFDPLSDQNKPEPKVWVAKNDQGCYDLYDNPGVHPQTGESLQPVTTEIVRSILRCFTPPAVASAPPMPQGDVAKKARELLNAQADSEIKREIERIMDDLKKNKQLSAGEKTLIDTYAELRDGERIIALHPQEWRKVSKPGRTVDFWRLDRDGCVQGRLGKRLLPPQGKCSESWIEHAIPTIGPDDLEMTSLSGKVEYVKLKYKPYQ